MPTAKGSLPSYPVLWRSWATGVLQAIGAPTSSTNYETLWAWTLAESPANAVMRWNNPLNTTQPEPGATNALSNGVKAYPNIAVGIGGTKDTLLNGYYPAVVQALRSSKPLSQWGPSEAANISKWGTNTAFIHRAGGSTSSGSDGTQAAPTFDPLGIGSAVGSAVGSFTTALSKDLVQGIEISVGLALMLAGVAILVLAALKINPAGAAKGVVALTPQGRAVGVAAAVAKPAAKPAAKPLSPQAQSAVAAAKAGRGSRLSPEVATELRSRGAA